MPFPVLEKQKQILWVFRVGCLVVLVWLVGLLAFPDRLNGVSADFRKFERRTGRFPQIHVSDGYLCSSRVKIALAG